MRVWLSTSARRVAATALVAALAAAVVGGVSIARAGSEGGGSQTLVLKEVQTGARFVNVLHRSRPGPGDEFIGHFKLLNHAGTRVGTGDVVCTILVGNRFSQCQATVRLAGGTLTFQGLSPENSTTFSLALTGGTGRYDQASGQVTRTSTGPNTSRDVIDIDW